MKSTKICCFFSTLEESSTISPFIKQAGVSPVNLLNVPLYLFAYSNQGSPQLISTKELQFAFMGDGLSDTEASNLSTLVHNMQTTLGRNY